MKCIECDESISDETLKYEVGYGPMFRLCQMLIVRAVCSCGNVLDTKYIEASCSPESWNDTGTFELIIAALERKPL